MSKPWTDETVAALVAAKDREIFRLNTELQRIIEADRNVEHANVDAKDREILSLKEKLTDRERMLGNVESELRRVRAMVDVVLDAESIAATITNGAEYHAHANTRTHAVAAAHAALAILAESQGNIGVALVKEMSKWLESTRRATLEQAAQTISALR
jgi:hypothetical protein